MCTYHIRIQATVAIGLGHKRRLEVWKIRFHRVSLVDANGNVTVATQPQAHDHNTVEAHPPHDRMDKPAPESALSKLPSTPHTKCEKRRETPARDDHPPLILLELRGGV